MVIYTYFVQIGSSYSFTGECSAGYHCIRGSSTKTPVDNITGQICPRGKFCIQGTETPENCPPGTFSNVTGLRGKNECLPCTPGMFCDRPGLTKPYGRCSSRYYCKGGALVPTPNDTITGGRCTTGHYCPIGSSTPLPCEVSWIKPAAFHSALLRLFFAI